MLRRQARLRREYLYRKANEAKKNLVEEKKARLKRALDENLVLPTDLRREALELQKAAEFDDQGGEGVSSHVDDEYRWAGVEDPRIMVTTSRDPSSRLKQFAKEIKLILPNAQRMNRGGHELEALVRACRANAVTDFIVLHEHRGMPGTLAHPQWTKLPRVGFGRLSGQVLFGERPAKAGTAHGAGWMVSLS